MCWMQHLLLLFDFWKCFKSNTITKRCSLTHDRFNRTLISAPSHRTLPPSQWIPNLDRWLHLDRITCSSPPVEREVDFTFDLWVLLIGVTNTSASYVLLLILETSTKQRNRMRELCWSHKSGKLLQRHIQNDTTKWDSGNFNTWIKHLLSFATPNACVVGLVSYLRGNSKDLHYVLFYSPLYPSLCVWC